MVGMRLPERRLTHFDCQALLDFSGGRTPRSNNLSSISKVLEPMLDFQYVHVDCIDTAVLKLSVVTGKPTYLSTVPYR